MHAFLCSAALGIAVVTLMLRADGSAGESIQQKFKEVTVERGVFRLAVSANGLIQTP